MEQKKKKKLSLATQIFIALVLGIVVGWALTGSPAVAVPTSSPSVRFF